MGYTQAGVGYQSTDTSRQAADDMGAKTETIKALVVASLQESAGGLTADEIAGDIGRHYGSVRPRLSELHNERKVKDSGIRRSGLFGKMHIVWTLDG